MLSVQFPGVQRQRCVKHKMENVLSYIPKKQREVVGEELRTIFYQESREKGEEMTHAWGRKYRREYPTAVECLWRDYEAGLTFYSFPVALEGDPHDQRHRAGE